MTNTYQLYATPTEAKQLLCAKLQIHSLGNKLGVGATTFGRIMLG
jgi:hypothetical protein